MQLSEKLIRVLTSSCLSLTYLFLPQFGGLLTAGILHVRQCCRCYMVALREDRKFRSYLGTIPRLCVHCCMGNSTF
ncbi:unnamed protein product, partial [Brassica oleracea]